MGSPFGEFPRARIFWATPWGVLSPLEQTRQHLDAIHTVSRLCALVGPTVDMIPEILASLEVPLPIRGALLFDGSAIPPRIVGWRAPVLESEKTEKSSRAGRTNLTVSVRRLLGGGVEVPAMVSGAEIALPPARPSTVARSRGEFHFVVLPLAIGRKPFGALQVATAQRLDEIGLALLSAVANQIALSLVRDRAWEREVTARDAAEQMRRDQDEVIRHERDARVAAEVAQRRLGFLAESSRVVMGTLEYATALPRIALIGVREMADFCAIDVPESSPNNSIAVRTSQLAEDRAPDVEAVLQRVVAKVLASGQASIASAGCEGLAESLGSDLRKSLGRVGIFSVLSVPLRAKGGVTGVLTLMSVRENRYSSADLFVAEDLGQRLSSAIEAGRMYREATATIRDRDRLLDVLARDLRAPLAEMVLTAAGAKDKKQGDDLKKDLEELRVGAARLSRILVDLLDSTQSEARTLLMEPADVQFSVLAAKAAATVRPAVEQKGVKLDLRVRKSADALFADPRRIEQVLSILLAHAVRRSTPGGTVSLQAQRMDGFLRVVVTDAGEPIRAEVLPQLFDRFWRARDSEGVGVDLGLPIAKGIVEAHGGLLWVESAAKGTTFTFSLPVR